MLFSLDFGFLILFSFPCRFLYVSCFWFLSAVRVSLRDKVLHAVLYIKVDDIFVERYGE